MELCERLVDGEKITGFKGLSRIQKSLEPFVRAVRELRALSKAVSGGKESSSQDSAQVLVAIVGDRCCTHDRRSHRKDRV